MGGNLQTLDSAAVRSALSWWLESGVDALVQEDARDWLKPVEPARKNPTADVPSTQPNVRIPDSTSLNALKDWLATGADVPMAVKSGRRALPHGPELAEVMLLSEAPVSSEGAADQPIDGAYWQLAVRMLAAIGFAADQAYSASLSCFQNPGKRMSAAERELCAEIARRHIRLAQPKRLILFGDAPCQALLGKSLVDARGQIHKVEGVRAVATFHPRHLVHRPLDKGLAWKDLLLLMEDEA